MDEELSQNTLSTLLIEARELLLAAELCWKSDEKLREQLRQGQVSLINNRLMQLYVDGDVELNWLYNLLAGLCVYYLSIGILMHRDQNRIIEKHSKHNISEYVAECGIELSLTQRRFLKRVEDAMSISMSTEDESWSINLEPQQMNIMKKMYAEQQAVTGEEKQAIDTLISRLIAVALKEISETLH